MAGGAKHGGVGGVLKDVLQPLAGQITAAFVYGSVAKQQESAGSDVDVLVVSDSLTHTRISSPRWSRGHCAPARHQPHFDNARGAGKARIAEGKAFFTRVVSTQDMAHGERAWPRHLRVCAEGKPLRQEPPDAGRSLT